MSSYETSLIRATEAAGLHRPVLVLDETRLALNLATLRSALPHNIHLRLADKSLPVPSLLQRGFDALGTKDVMSFHLPLTARVLAEFPETQALMGKPMPVAAAAQFLRDCPDADRVTWLIDSGERLAEYRALATDTGRALKIAFEVNIGLGRGGLQTPIALRDCLAETSTLNVRGVMGYEAHVHALPGFLGGGTPAQARAMHALQAFTDCLADSQRQIINTGGSSTIMGLPADGPGNDFTLGSIMVKPSDFDQAVNAAIQPALFIVTPVLKTYPHALPGHPRLSRALQAMRLIRDRIVFVYGGKWMAKPVYPAGLGTSPFFDASSNQQGFCLPRGAEPPSHIILRPTQCEAVLQHFPTIHLFDGRAITAEIAPFPIV